MKWCIRGKCVDDGSREINGNWGEWSDYGRCSRTCGGWCPTQNERMQQSKVLLGNALCHNVTGQANYIHVFPRKILVSHDWIT